LLCLHLHPSSRLIRRLMSWGDRCGGPWSDPLAVRFVSSVGCAGACRGQLRVNLGVVTPQAAISCSGLANGFGSYGSCCHWKTSYFKTLVSKLGFYFCPFMVLLIVSPRASNIWLCLYVRVVVCLMHPQTEPAMWCWLLAAVWVAQLLLLLQRCQSLCLPDKRLLFCMFTPKVVMLRMKGVVDGRTWIHIALQTLLSLTIGLDQLSYASTFLCASIF
jgi:hypothetical protein